MKRGSLFFAAGAIALAALVFLPPENLHAKVNFGRIQAVKNKVRQLKDKKENAGQKIQYKLGPQTKVLSAQTNSCLFYVSPDSATYKYTLQASEIATLHLGNIILSTQGSGYLKKVVSLVNTGSEYQVMTTTAGLNEAFDMLNLEFHKTITPDDANVQSLQQTAGMNVQGVGTKFNFSTNTVLYDADGNHATTNDQITSGLSFMFGIDVDVKIDMPDPQHLNQFYLKVNTEKELGLTVSAKVGASVTKEYPLSPTIKAPIWAMPPVILELKPKYMITASLGGVFDVVASGTDSSYTGVICDNNCFNGNNWRVESSSSSHFSVTKASGSAELSLQMGPDVELSAKLCDIIGPFFDLFVGGKASVTTPVNHLPYTISLVAEASGGIKAEVDAWFVNVTLFSIEASLLKYEYVIKDGVLLNQAPAISAVSANPASISTGAATTVTCSASDSDGDTLTYAWSAASGTLVKNGSQATWTAPASTGVYTVSCAVSDSYGGSVQKSASVVVSAAVNHAPDTIDDSNIKIVLNHSIADITELRYKQGSGYNWVDNYWNDAQYGGPIGLSVVGAPHETATLVSWSSGTASCTFNYTTNLGNKTVSISWDANGVEVFVDAVLNQSALLGGFTKPGGDNTMSDYATNSISAPTIHQFTYPGGSTLIWSGTAQWMALWDTNFLEVFGYKTDTPRSMRYGNGASVDGPFVELPVGENIFKLALKNKSGANWWSVIQGLNLTP
ncbi:MAG: hypothetical protein HY796_13645 [Elusimicrobia bacterium]|nr:hypothetical protein [Elusimicrobiota bacterium]